MEKKGAKIRKILEILKKLDKVGSESLLFCYSSKRFWQIIGQRRMKKLGWKPKEEFLADIENKARKRFNDIIHYLKKNGYITKQNHSGSAVWQITESGKKKYFDLQQNLYTESWPILKPAAPISKQDNDQKIIVFDIPETHKKVREWIRTTLRAFEFRMLQKSVWIGNTALPENFFHHLRALKLVKNIHIFTIKNLGTIKNEKN